MKYLLITLLTLMITASAVLATTGTLKGTVIDESNLALPGVTVVLKGTTTGVLTDEAGRFEISNIPSGRQTIVFTLLSYVKVKKEVVIEAGKVTTLSVTMEEDRVELDEVVIVTKPIRIKKKNRKNKGKQPADMVTDVAEGTIGVTEDEYDDFVLLDPDKEEPTIEESIAVKQVLAPEPSIRIKDAPKPKKDQSESVRTKKVDKEPKVKDPIEPGHKSEEYAEIFENAFQVVKDAPLSTFSVDVDRASYANVRRFLNQGQMPPKHAVRIEEMVNYFPYEYPNAEGDEPFSIITDIAECPWSAGHHLFQIGLKGKVLSEEEAPANNLVFLIDVSGSMSSANKLPLVKKSMEILVEKLRPIDRVAIVVYSGAAGEVLPSTSGDQKDKIMAAINNMEAGGGTAGGAGINLAYKIAKNNLSEEGNNRVILATDGDFNIGASSDTELVKMIESRRNQGIFLTILGFGMGNYKDSKMEKLADYGNGNYAYIDNLGEATKMLKTEFSSTLYTIAKDVKIQLEFNPAKVQSYRLIGYENRMLKAEDFNDDKKDAGEIGAGHTVTALYEIVPAGSRPVSTDANAKVDPLRYQENNLSKEGKYSDEWLTVKLRYKQPREDVSTKIEDNIITGVRGFEDASETLRFASAVAGFGMLLRDSKHKGGLTYDSVLEMAERAQGVDLDGYRAEFIQLVKKARGLADTQ